MSGSRAVAIVGMGAVMPGAEDAATFWHNIREGRSSITDVPPERWDPELYYDPDPAAPDKTYTRIGGWVRAFPWEPFAWKLPIPPKVADQLDEGQKWAISVARSALLDAGWPDWSVDGERVAVILGNALAGEKHYDTNLRIQFPEFARALASSPAFGELPPDVRAQILDEAHDAHVSRSLPITEDTMPGELANVLAGRIANLFDFRGPNFTTDAACASALAGMNAAIQGLNSEQFDVAISGGVDRNMGVAAFVKFCKIGALSATGSRPFAAGADGFVMGEGAALFVLKRLADAERDGDRIYAVVRGIAGSSDGKGKGITAPNPVGQRLAVERAWRDAGLKPADASMIEGHGTSTRVGDSAELDALHAAFGDTGLPVGSIALGSVKSNIGHLKAAAGAAGLFKTVMALHEKVLPPSLHADELNPNVDWSHSPFRVNTELREWETPATGVRTAGVSAFGFGGTNFHAVLEEYVPGRIPTSDRRMFAVGDVPTADVHATVTTPAKAPLRGALVLGGADEAALARQLETVAADAAAGRAPAPAAPDPALADAPVRVAIDYGDAAELATKATKAAGALTSGNAQLLTLLRAQGVHVGRGPAGKVAFLYTGQGSQYVNMGRALADAEPIVADTFDEADRIMTPLLGRPLSDYLFVDATDPDAVAAAEQQLLQTEITQPAVLTVDLALTRLLDAYGIRPDMVMGHSLGEYGALVAAGALDLDAALEAVSARGHEMAALSIEDNGAMAAVFAPLAEIERIVEEADGYVVLANVNSTSQAVIGGATAAVEATIARFTDAGHTAVRIPVSHAFHTSIVAPASDPLKRALLRLDLRPPTLPIIKNVDGGFYPTPTSTEPADVASVRDEMLEILGRQVASPVQFVAGLRTLYEAGARVFVEVGPKKALAVFAEDVLGSVHDNVVTLFTNHPKQGDVVAFNQALCGLYAAGLGLRPTPATPGSATPHTSHAPAMSAERPTSRTTMSDDTYRELGQLFARFLDEGRRIYEGGEHQGGEEGRPASAPVVEGPEPTGHVKIVVTGAALGLPGVDDVFDDRNVGRILAGESFIDVVPTRLRELMADKHITRLVKRDKGDPTFETIDSVSDVIKLAGRRAPFDLATTFGIDPERARAYDMVDALAIGVGFDALRDAGIPLAMQYRTTTVGSELPDHWGLPAALRDDTGVIFASAFPGYDAFADDITRYHEDRARHERLRELTDLRARMADDDPLVAELDRRIHDVTHAIETDGYAFDRRFLFRALSMGHAQFAELVGARGPNTQVNAACASTTQAVALAEDWIRAGRCRRVVVIAADDVTSDILLPWTASGFLATGAAATDEAVEDAALPFDNRRHGMLMGMGAAALVVETADAAAERGIQPICEVVATAVANSAFHGTRLDVDHISGVMERLLTTAEGRGLDRHGIAPSTVFVSHETYTPARGGSAAAEINALRHSFGADADKVVIANTKGFTGHAMGAGIEDVVAVKALETGIVPPVANFKEVDPDLGELNLSRGGAYPVTHALRLAAGFGSQIAMALLAWTPMPDGRRRHPDELGYASRMVDPARWQSWLTDVTGRRDPQLEVDHRRLRVADTGAPQTAPAAPASVAPATVTTVAAPPEPAPTEEAPAPAEATVAERVVAMVSELTGYPPDLLDLDLDLEADLGVDTVKQAEVFAALREEFGIARDDDLALRDFPTLTHVIGFVRDRTATRADANVDEPDATAADAPETAPTATAPAELDDEDVAERVLALVSEQTGYPPDLLDLDLDLEADLGVDTVKQAEVFAAVREQFGIERDDTLQLREFPTLNDVIRFVHERAGVEGDARPFVETAPASPPVRIPPPVAGDLAATDRLPRRVPTPVLRPPLAWCVPTGVTLGAGDRVILLPDESGVGEALTAQLTGRGVTPLVLSPTIATDDLIEQVGIWLGEGEITGVYWLAALDEEPAVADLDLDGWRAALRRRVKHLYATMRALDGHVGAGGTFLVSATRLGGQLGYGAAGATAPMGGAVSGFTKAYAREQPDALVKIVDLPVGSGTADVAATLVEETLTDPGAVEIGRIGDRRWTVALREIPFGDEVPAGAMTLDHDTVVVVTGAAGSIVSAIVADLATAAGGGTFHLLDLTPAPDPADPDLEAFTSDRDGLKTTLADRLRAAGERPTPVAIGRALAGIERRHAALAAIQAVEDAGGSAAYHAVDLTDPDAVAAVVDEVRTRHGRIDVLLHAAGIEISRTLADKAPAEYDRVFDVKADGWFNLMHAAGDLDIGATVVFSSVAGRFGNAGQTDYSAANDLLCKQTTALARTRPGTRGIALDWTAWGGIGMATRGSIPTVMAMAGIELLPPEAGVAWIRRELTASGAVGEVVVAGALGILGDERHPTGGLDPAAVDVTGAGPMVGTVTGMGVATGLTVETTLDPAAQPFLDDHRIDGTPVLPGVMGIEGFAEVARLLAGDLVVADVHDVAFLAPFKFYRGEPRTLTITAQVRADRDDLVVDCRLSGTRTLPTSPEPQVTTHFTASVRLATSPDDEPGTPIAVPAASARAAGADAIYRVYFHGPAYQVLAEAWRADGGPVGRFADDLPPENTPVEVTTSMAPRLLELCFQTAGLWEVGTAGRLALPAQVDRVVLTRAPAAARAPLYAVAHPGDDGFDCVVVDADGAPVARVEGYRTVALPTEVDPERRAPLTDAMA